MNAAVEAEKKPVIYVKRRGNALGFWFFEMLLRTAGLKAAYLLLEFVCSYYLIFDREAVASAMFYIEKRFPEAGTLKKYWHTHRLFVNQGRQLVDRYAAARKPDLFQFMEHNAEGALETLQQSSQGVVLLTSHAGNWQVALKHMSHLSKEICLVMRPEDNAALQSSLQMAVHGKPVTCIDPQGHLGGVLEMIQALQEGKMVCMMGDRSYGFDTVEVPFLGKTAYFPYGAFFVAAAAKCPVIPFLTHKTSEREYAVSVEKVWRPVYEKGRPRKEQLQQWVAEYAALLDDYAENHPYDCFLFHNVWVQEKGAGNDGK